jgi:hypothetical protein
MKAINEADLMVADAERRVEAVHAALLADVRDFAERMDRLATRLKSEGTDAHFNELGEVQDRGLHIDRALALLAAGRASRNGMRSLLERARHEGTP